MRFRPTLVSFLGCLWLAALVGVTPLRAAEEAPDADAPAEADAPAPTLDRVELLDGSTILGEIVDLGGGTLSIKTAFGIDEIVKVTWDQVKSVRSDRRHTYVLADGTVITGSIAASADGSISIESEAISGASTVPIAQVTAINPPPTKDVVLGGSFNIGGSISDGNAQNKTANINGEVVARSERQRLTLKGFWNYAEDDVKITVRNIGGSGKYDYFFKDINERLFAFASVVLLKDEFEDLNLRTAISAGPGYQIFEKGDFESIFLEGLEAYAEAGISYFNEDRRTADTKKYMAAKWGFKLDWRFCPAARVFHTHEIYPSVERLSDLYVVTEQGVRIDLGAGFTAGVQVNWRWNSTPTPGFERSNTIYLFTLGYDFEI